MNINVLLFIIGLTIGHILIWIQTNGQLIHNGHIIWDIIRDRPFLMSLMGVPISYLMIWTTKIGYLGFDYKAWPLRIIGFGIGTIVFGLGTYFGLGEVPSTKAIISIGLCILIILIQILL